MSAPAREAIATVLGLEPGQVALGNGGDGFYLFQSSDVLLANCVAEGNQNGLANVGSTSVRIAGGIFFGNAMSGFSFNGTADAPQTRITGGPIVAENGRGAMSIADRSYPTVFGVMPAPPVPAPGVPLTNPFPFDATLYITGGAVRGISVQGNNVFGVTNGTVRLAAGQFIQLYYNIPPSWTWFID